MSIKLSVIVLTYNHELYIRQAIESILSQKVNFQLEIIIADDGSQDNTPLILAELQEENPTVIRRMKSVKNVGILANSASMMREFNGEYIALLDGDDYWENEHKIQRQVDFLDQHPEYNGVFHDAKIVHADADAGRKLFTDKYLYSQSYNYQETVFPSDLVKRMILPSASVVFRQNSPYESVFEIADDNYSFLWKLCCFAIKRSKFHYINEPLSVYRNHKKGISKSNNQAFHGSHIAFLKLLLKDDFYRDYKYEICSSIVHEYTIILNAKDQVGKRAKRGFFRQYLLFELRKIRHYRKKLMN